MSVVVLSGHRAIDLVYLLVNLSRYLYQVTAKGPFWSSSPAATCY